MARYLYPPGNLLHDLPTDRTHIALPRDAAERAAWSEEAGYDVVGRITWVDGQQRGLSRESVENAITRDVPDWETRPD